MKIPDNISVKEFKELQKKGIIEIGDKGLKSGTLSKEYENHLKKEKKPKHRNSRVEYKGLNFQSIKERDRYIFHEFQKENGKIIDFIWQHPMPFIYESQIMFIYWLDYKVIHRDTITYEDVKALDKKTNKYLTTGVFDLKKKLIQKQYNLKIELV